MTAYSKAAKKRMRELGAIYAAALPALDNHHLLQGLPDTTVAYLNLGDRDGVYDPEHRLILINSETRPERQRFTLAHEISHALLLNDEDLLSDLHDYYEGDELEGQIEILCNVGAAAILIRNEWLEELTARFGYTGRTLAELTHRANVSYSVAAYVLAEQTPAPVIYSLCKKISGHLCVSVSAASPSAQYAWTVGTPVPPEHPISEVCQTYLPISCPSYIPFRSGKKMPAFLQAYPAREGLVTASFALA